MRRLVWFGLGVGSSVWARRTVRRRVEAYRPGPVARQVTERARNVQAEVRAAVQEGRSAMRTYRDDARAEVEASARRSRIRSVS